MRLGIMQPYFFPFLGYYSLIKNTDRWIVFDNVQYIRHGWINRNRILKPSEGWQYIIVPLAKHSRDVIIRDIQISPNMDWKSRLLGQLAHYKNKAPFYRETIDMVYQALDINTSSIRDLNIHVLEITCKYLGIKFDYMISSELGISIETIQSPGVWALEISKHLGASYYLNPIGGKEIFDSDKFNNSGITLEYLNLELKPYLQKRKDFEPGLSIIDFLMFMPHNEIDEYLSPTIDPA